MTPQEAIEICRAEAATDGYISFTDDQFRMMGPEHVEALRNEFGKHSLMLLPPHEVKFFEWLKVVDPDVWNDLWGDVPDSAYQVSLAFLPDFTGANAGGAFVICELRSVDNYFFSPNLLLEKESNDYVAALKDRFMRRDSLSMAQTLALEASIGPIDIWHFAYRHGVDVGAAKNAVKILVDDRILLHVTDADHLSQFFDIA